MKNILYITTVPMDLNKPDGVQKKILSHIKVFSEFYNVTLLCRYEERICTVNGQNYDVMAISDSESRKELFSSAKTLIKNHQCDAMYIRYPNTDPLFLSLLRYSVKHGCINIVEIPTFPYSSEGKESIRGRIVSLVDRLFRVGLRKYVNRIVTYSDDEMIFGVKTIKTINGIEFDSIKIKHSVIENSKIIRMIAVSSMYRVHGYERIIEGLSLYYKNTNPLIKVYFDLVGDGDFVPLYKELVTKYNLEEYVVFHGKLFNEDLEKVYSNANIGINSLAIHRQGLLMESTLKTKEYVAHGLPVVSSSFVDAFDEESNQEFVLRVSPDDSVVDIDEVVVFYQNLISDTNPLDMSRKIREAGRNKCDMIQTLMPIINYIKQS